MGRGRVGVWSVFAGLSGLIFETEELVDLRECVFLRATFIAYQQDEYGLTISPFLDLVKGVGSSVCRIATDEPVSFTQSEAAIPLRYPNASF